MKTKVSLILTVAVLFNTAFAVSFPDLKGYDWAKGYIERMSELGIVTGYKDGTFKPANRVAKYEAMVVLYRTLVAQGLIDQEESKVLVVRHGGILEKYAVPEWPNLREAIAFFIDRNVISEQDLAKFGTSARGVPISRQEVAIFYGKALNVFLQEDINKIIALGFKDLSQMSFEGKVYANVLFSHNIMGGDNKGYFNPTDSLNRAGLTKILTVSMDALAKAKVKTSDEKVVDATVFVTIMDQTKRVVFYDKNTPTRAYNEVIDESVTIEISGKPGTIADLAVNLPVQLTYENDKLIKISAQAVLVVPKTVTGVVREVLTRNSVNYVYITDDAKNEIAFYEIAANAPILSGGVAKSLNQILMGDRVTLTLVASKVTAIDCITKVNHYSGILKAVNLEGKGQLTLDINGVTRSFALQEGVGVTRNNSPKTLSALTIGDQIEILTTYDVVDSIVAKGKSNTIKDNLIGVVKTVNLVNTDLNIVTLEVAGREYTCHIALKTAIRDFNGVQIALSSIKEGDILFMYGILQDYIFSPDLVFKPE